MLPVIVDPPKTEVASADVIRFVKIDGKVVERKGEKKPDEIKALAKAAQERKEALDELSAMGQLEEATRPDRPRPTSEELAAAKAKEAVNE